MTVHLSPEPLLDTWRGAAALAANSRYSSWAYGAEGAAYSNGAGGAAGSFGGGGGVFGDPFGPGSGALLRQQYEEAGVEYLKEFRGFKYPEL